jgi:hypothetical protein
MSPVKTSSRRDNSIKMNFRYFECELGDWIQVPGIESNCGVH